MNGTAKAKVLEVQAYTDQLAEALAAVKISSDGVYEAYMNEYSMATLNREREGLRSSVEDLEKVLSELTGWEVTIGARLR